jgi:DNA-directed RNA polymerase subunit L
MSKIQVKNIQTVDLSPKVKNPELAKTILGSYQPKKFSFEVLGGNNALCNGIRRTVVSECLVKVLSFDFGDFETDNAFCLNDNILERIMRIPIDQDTPLDATFELDIINKQSKNIIDVKAGDIKITFAGKQNPLKKLPFNETATLFTLEPNKYTRIKNIKIKTGFGYDRAWFTFAFNAASVPLDIKPINHHEASIDYDKLNYTDETGYSSSVSDPHHHRISFKTNGTCPPERIVHTACENLIARLEYIVMLFPKIISADNIYYLTIVGESHTIGYLLTKTIYDLYPKIGAVTCSSDQIIRSVTIKVKTSDDITEVFKKAIEHAIKQLTEIKKAFE